MAEEDAGDEGMLSSVRQGAEGSAEESERGWKNHFMIHLGRGRVPALSETNRILSDPGKSCELRLASCDAYKSSSATVSAAIRQASLEVATWQPSTSLRATFLREKFAEKIAINFLRTRCQISRDMTGVVFPLFKGQPTLRKGARPSYHHCW
jgi:hypothetical protein